MAVFSGALLAIALLSGCGTTTPSQTTAPTPDPTQFAAIPPGVSNVDYGSLELRERAVIISNNQK